MVALIQEYWFKEANNKKEYRMISYGRSSLCHKIIVLYHLALDKKISSIISNSSIHELKSFSLLKLFFTEYSLTQFE